MEYLLAWLLGLLAASLAVALLVSKRRLQAARAAAANSEQRWIEALDAAGHGVWDWDLRLDRVFYSRRWKAMLGYREQEIEAHFAEWRQRVHPDDLTAALAAIDRHCRGETEQFSILHRLRAKDGRYRWSLGQGAVIERDAHGRAVRMVGTNTDVTRYRETEIALQEKDALLSVLVNQAPDSMILIDPEELSIVEFNQAAPEALGYTAKEFAELTVADIEAEQSPHEQRTTAQQVLEEGVVVFDARHRHKDGSLRDVRVSARSVRQDGRVYFACVFKDLTDLREAERASEALHRKLQATFEQAAVGMAHLAPDGRFMSVNSRVCEFLGYSAGTLAKQRLQELTHPDDTPERSRLTERLLAGQIASFRIEVRLFRARNDWAWTLLTLSLVRDARGAPDYFIAVLEDIGERKRDEKQLHLSAQMVDKATYAIIATGMDGRIHVYNPAAERLLGYSAREMLERKTPLDFHLAEEVRARAHALSEELGEHIAPGFEVFVRPVLRHGEDTREWTLRRRDGEQIVVLVSLTALRDSDGEPQGILGNLADITPLRRATEALRWERDRAQRYLETVNSMIIALDGAARITLANPFACELLGYPQSELLGRDWLSCCVSASEHDRLEPMLECMRQRLGRPLGEAGATRDCDYIEHQVRCADGSQRLIGWRSNLLGDESGRVVGLLFVGNDVTAQRSMEFARVEALEEAERLAGLKNAFLANMSHEIRTPLNAILGLAHIGRRDFAGDEAGAVFGRIQEAGRHLLALINDILDFSKIEAGKVVIHAQPFRLADSIAELKSMIRPQVSAKGLGLRVDAARGLPEWVEGDALRLRQILINLLGNAVKFTAAGEVSLTVAAAGDQIRFRVTDTGIGMSEEQIGRIFQRFEQAESGTARAYSGTGLGLTISYNLAQLMGGSLSVESAPDAGSCFELRLPLPVVEAPSGTQRDAGADQRVGQRANQRASVDGERLKGLHVLVVDDVDVNLIVTEDLLSHEGARVMTATNGREALERVRESAADPYELVLMDVQMPVMDGYEATRRIRALVPELPVIGLTAHAFAEERDRCLEAGMVAHLSKPVEIDLLAQTLSFWRKGSAGQAAPDSGQGAIDAVARRVPTAAAETIPAEPGASSELGPATHPPIDWAALRHRFAASPGLIARLMQAAREREAASPAELRALAAAGDLDGFFRKTHALKGLAANLCAEPLRASANDLCEQARAGDSRALDGADSLASKVEAFLAELDAASSWI